MMIWLVKVTARLVEYVLSGDHYDAVRVTPDSGRAYVVVHAPM